MKISVLGDIHGNLEALDAVLADLDSIGPDKVYCTGDIVGYGPSPRECLAKIREREWPILMGNWDHVVAGLLKSDPEQFNPYAKASAYWTRGALAPPVPTM